MSARADLLAGCSSLMSSMVPVSHTKPDDEAFPVSTGLATTEGTNAGCSMSGANNGPALLFSTVDESIRLGVSGKTAKGLGSFESSSSRPSTIEPPGIAVRSSVTIVVSSAVCDCQMIENTISPAVPIVPPRTRRPGNLGAGLTEETRLTRSASCRTRLIDCSDSRNQALREGPPPPRSPAFDQKSCSSATFCSVGSAGSAGSLGCPTICVDAGKRGGNSRRLHARRNTRFCIAKPRLIEWGRQNIFSMPANSRSFVPE